MMLLYSHHTFLVIRSTLMLHSFIYRLPVFCFKAEALGGFAVELGCDVIEFDGLVPLFLNPFWIIHGCSGTLASDNLCSGFLFRSLLIRS